MKYLYAKKVIALSVLLLTAISTMALSIKGTVVDDTKVPLPGVNVVIKGTTQGAVTDLDGNFEIREVKAGDYTIVVTFIGFQTKELMVSVPATGTMAPLNISLASKTEMLDEFIVVGYGVQRKREVTGSIAKVSGKEIAELPVPSFESALQGQAAGVSVTTGSGLAGSASLVRIRGIASISAGGDPLYVVDGIPIISDNFIGGNSGGMNTNPLAAINPEDIESIEILKDAASTGIYGSRGSNGVILITTKSAKKDGLTFNFKTRLGFSNPTARPNMLNNTNYLQLVQEAYENDGGVGQAPLQNTIPWESAQRTNTDWVDQTIGTGFKQLYSLSASYKKNKLGAYASFSFDDNASYLVGNSYDRLNGKLNLDYKVNDKLILKGSTNITRGVNHRVNAAWSGGLGAAMSTALPIYPVKWDSTQVSNPYTGEYTVNDNGDTVAYANEGDYWIESGVGNNPTAQREWTDWRVTEIRTINNLNFIYSPTKKVTFNGRFGYESMNWREDQWTSNKMNQTLDENPDLGTANLKQTKLDNFSSTLTGQYNSTFKKIHKVGLLGGIEHQFQQQEFITDKHVYNTAPAALDKYDAEDSTIVAPGTNRVQKLAFQSFFGRANYVYKGKYIAQATARVDGSSRFGPNNKYGFFPSASVGWIVSEEKFLKGNKVFSFLKVKASWGITGNANIPGNLYQENWEAATNTYNGSGYLFQTQLPNPDIKWETSHTIDVGFELGLLEDRIVTEFSYYNKRTKDVFMYLAVPPSFGYTNWWDNVGEILNWGVELNVTSHNLTKKLKWDTKINLAYNYNEIVSIGDYSPDAVSGGTNDTRVVPGSPVGTNYLVRFSHVDKATGQPVYLDINGEETYTWSPNDRVPVGDILPDLVGGVTNMFRYKQWDLSFLVTFSIGNKIYDSSSKRQLGVVTDWNMREEIYDRWRKPGDETTYPILTQNTANYGSSTPWINTDMWLHDGDYIRFKNLSLGYSFGKVAKDKIDNLKVQFSMTNFLTFTKFQGLDPEIARDFADNADRNMSGNITYLTPPQEKTFNFTISASF